MIKADRIGVGIGGLIDVGVGIVGIVGRAALVKIRGAGWWSSWVGLLVRVWVESRLWDE